MTMRYKLHLWQLLIILSLCLPLNAPAQASPAEQERIPLAYGQTVTGTIDNIRFFQQYMFTGQAGDSIVITMESLSGNLDPLLLLGDAALNLIAEDDDSGGGFNARIEVVLPAEGVYVIEATRYGQDSEGGQSAGDYRLTLLANQATSSNAAQPSGILSPLAFGNTTRGILTEQDAYHLFWFLGQPGDQINIQSTLSVGMSAALTLYDDTLTEIQRDTTGRLLQVDLDSEGVYFAALALTDPAAGGTYAISLFGRRDDAEVDVPALPIAGGDRIQGTITDEQPAARYIFQGQANDQILIHMDAVTDTLDPFLYLYGPGGEIIGQDDDSGADSNAELAAVLPADGEYVIVAARFGRGNGTSTGAYILGLEAGTATLPVFIPESTAPTLPTEFEGLPQIQYGDVVSGDVDAQAYYQAYVFRASAEDEIIITMENTGDNLDPMVLLLDETLATIAQHDDISDENKNARLAFTVPEDGFYAVLATRYNGETGTTSGSFTLSLSATNARRHAQVGTLLPADQLTPVEPFSGELTDEAMLNVFAFYALRNDPIQLVIDAAGPLGEDNILLLTDAELNELAVSRDGELQFEAPADGLYLALVTRENGPTGNARGFYDLGLYGPDPGARERLAGIPAEETFGPGSVLPYGIVITGEISDAQPQINYFFDAQTGDRITVRMEALEPTLDPSVAILNETGEELVRDDDSAGNLNALITAYLITAPGRYTIVASRFDGIRGASRGQFELALAGVPVSSPSAQPSGAGSSAGQAIQITAGQTVSGTINNDQMANFYAFDSQAGETLEIQMVRTSDNLDPFLALLDANQTLLATDDDSAGDQNARLRFVVPADGLYYIAASRFELTEGTTTGDYLLSMLTAPGQPE
jgi:hypothetical protein